MIAKIKKAAAALLRKAKPVVTPAVRAFLSAGFATLVASGADWAHITDISVIEKAAIAGVAAGLPVLEAAVSAFLSSGHALTLGNAVRYRSAKAKAVRSGAVH
jgi:hypothetical protein